jgi:hypothetical protein
MSFVITKIHIKPVYFSIRTVMRNVSRKASKIRTTENSRSVFSVTIRYSATKFTINIR